MTAEDVQARVERIRRMAGDDEIAHSEEDKLRDDVLRAIASASGEDPVLLARAVLATSEIDFNRWCA